jgi:uncharacterized protein with ParB-like and HNH nuclease domain
MAIKNDKIIRLKNVIKDTTISFFAECFSSGTRQKSSLPSKTLGKELFCRVFFSTLGKDNLKSYFKALN